MAALVDPGAAEDVRAGRLVRGLSYSGFGVEPAVSAAAPAGGPSRTRHEEPAPRAGGGTDEARAAEARQAAASEAAARSEAQAETERRAAWEQATEQLAAAEAAEAAARAVQVDLEAELERARERLRDVERRVADASLETRTLAGVMRRARAAVDAAMTSAPR